MIAFKLCYIVFSLLETSILQYENTKVRKPFLSASYLVEKSQDQAEDEGKTIRIKKSKKLQFLSKSRTECFYFENK